MRNLHFLQDSALLNLLTERADQLTQLHKEQNLGKQYQKCKKDIQEIQSEIENRKITRTSLTRNKNHN